MSEKFFEIVSPQNKPFYDVPVFLSVSDNKILIGTRFCEELLLIISLEGSHLSQVISVNNSKIQDAIWTPLGNIVYVASEQAFFGKTFVIIVSESCEVIKTHMIVDAKSVTLSGNVIYLRTSFELYYSSDDGVSWETFTFIEFEDRWWPEQLIEISAKTGNVCFVKGYESKPVNAISILHEYKENLNLRVYIKKRAYYLTWKNINVTTTDGERIGTRDFTFLHDGHMNIFIYDYEKQDIYVLSVNGRNIHKLLSVNITMTTKLMAFNMNKKLLYIGCKTGVLIYNLIYELHNEL